MKISIQKPQSIYELGLRDNQEDWIFPKLGEATEKSRLFIVCDGMGGYERGEVASQVVGETISSYIIKHHTDDTTFDDDILREAINEALNELDKFASEDNSIRMGTTLALVFFHKGGCVMAHIGDSRIYHVRPSERRIIYKSRDHSLVYDLFQAEEITLEEMQSHPKKNIITRALMPNMGERPTASIAHTADIREGDCVYLCSDGMLEGMDDNDLLMILCADDTIENKVEKLIISSYDNLDNHSAHLFYINKVEQEDGDNELATDEDIVRFNAIHLEEKEIDRQNDARPQIHKNYACFPKKDYKQLLIYIITLIIGFICAMILLYFYKFL